MAKPPHLYIYQPPSSFTSSIPPLPPSTNCPLANTHPLPSALIPHYQSSSPVFSPPPPCILICLALNASANPPARLGARLLWLSGVALPLPPSPILTALSLGASGGAGFLPPATPAPGRLGGAGGVGLAFVTETDGRGPGLGVPFMPLKPLVGSVAVVA